MSVVPWPALNGTLDGPMPMSVPSMALCLCPQMVLCFVFSSKDREQPWPAVLDGHAAGGRAKLGLLSCLRLGSAQVRVCPKNGRGLQGAALKRFRHGGGCIEAV